METSASFEARSAPLPYPTHQISFRFRELTMPWESVAPNHGVRVMKEVGVGLDEKRHRAVEIWPIRMVNPSSTLARLKSFSDWYSVDAIRPNDQRKKRTSACRSGTILKALPFFPTPNTAEFGVSIDCNCRTFPTVLPGWNSGRSEAGWR